MGIVAKASGEFIPAPAGSHSAVCVDVIDLGMVTTEWQGKKKEQHKIKVVWQIDEEMADSRLFTVHRRYTLSLGEKAALKKDLESWRGKAFSTEELLGFDVEKLIGVPCYLSVIHENKSGSTYANISGVMKLPKGMPALAPRHGEYTRVKDREPQQQDREYSQEITDDDVPF